MTGRVEHPGWLAINQEVEMERRLGHSVAWRKPVKVVRHTRAQVVVSDGDTEWYFAARYGGYHLTPRYIDYITTLNPKRETS